MQSQQASHQAPQMHILTVCCRRAQNWQGAACGCSGSRVPPQVPQVPTPIVYWCWRWEGCQQRWGPRSVSRALRATQLPAMRGEPLQGWGSLLQAGRGTPSVC